MQNQPGKYNFKPSDAQRHFPLGSLLLVVFLVGLGYLLWVVLGENISPQVIWAELQKDPTWLLDRMFGSLAEIGRGLNNAFGGFFRR